MAQKTFISEILTSADVNLYLAGEGGAWQSYTPTVTQSGSVTVTNTRSRFARYGRTIHVSVKLTVTGSGTASNAVNISLPVTAASTDAAAAGSGSIFDTSVTVDHRGLPFLNSTTVFAFVPTANTASGALGANGFTAALAVGDVISAGFTYEAAS